MESKSHQNGQINPVECKNSWRRACFYLMRETNEQDRSLKLRPRQMDRDFFILGEREMSNVKVLAVFCLVVILKANSAFAQRYGNSHRSNHHNPYNSSSCSVQLVDSYGYILDQFYSVQDFNGMCKEGLRQCNREKKLRGLHMASCRSQRAGNVNRPLPPGTGGYSPNPYPGNGYGHPPVSRFDHLLSLTDRELAQEAAFGIGMCQVQQGSWGSGCDYYVKRAGIGYPQGTGCSDSNYTQAFGCNSWDDHKNAGCIIRKAIMRGDC